jgi:integrase/recombinase XerD
MLLKQIIIEVQSLCPDVNHVDLQTKISSILSQYDIKPSRLPGAHPDVQDKVELFLSVKKIEG